MLPTNTLTPYNRTAFDLIELHLSGMPCFDKKSTRTACSTVCYRVRELVSQVMAQIHAFQQGVDVQEFSNNVRYSFFDMCFLSSTFSNGIRD